MGDRRQPDPICGGKFFEFRNLRSAEGFRDVLMKSVVLHQKIGRKNRNELWAGINFGSSVGQEKGDIYTPAHFTKGPPTQ